MKKNLKNFMMRGAMFAWCGPVITAIVWAALYASGAITELTVREVVTGIISTTLMAFIAAGISIVYQIENLPKSFAGLIQMSVLYFDYLGFYLLNGWIPLNRIPVFTLIFVAVFAVIWFIIYMSVRIKVNRMNQLIKHE
ncbi:MAG: DUF3021 domain-containing protein [Oscillospiraceae bacterium]|nr:DUF3021 domain-containing protein [Oscillospiraceae bacterium]